MKIVTSESVFSGHPDKICDQISDAILDAILAQDKNARVAVECAIKDDLVVIFGEVTTTARVDYGFVAAKVLKEIGYEEEFHFLVRISKQSADIALGVDATKTHEQGAGDQGIMYGYAIADTPEMMPMPIVIAHKIARAMDDIRKAKYRHIFGPDGKCQVSVKYENGISAGIDTVIVSAQTKPGVMLYQAKEIILYEVLAPILKKDLFTAKILINPTGSFEIGGPFGDSGLTGRKIMVDTYGGVAHHGGGAFSGKDVSKVDRCAAYYARYVARIIVSSELADTCEVAVSYSIGIANPISISVDTFGTGKISDERITNFVKEQFDFSPANIRKELKLDQVKFRDLACYGHVGREDLPVQWENVRAKVASLFVTCEETKSAS
jgi:S-adenosylmethionine synthetase